MKIISVGAFFLTCFRLAVFSGLPVFAKIILEVICLIFQKINRNDVPQRGIQARSL